MVMIIRTKKKKTNRFVSGFTAIYMQILSTLMLPLMLLQQIIGTRLLLLRKIGSKFIFLQSVRVYI